MTTTVALDIITAGPDPYTDAIIDVGAVECENGEITRSFGELINTPDARNCGRAGITPTMLEGARSSNDVLDDLLEFLPEKAVYISHHAEAVSQFLQHATRDRFLHPILDTSELARICFPDQASYQLPDLLHALNIPPAAGHWSIAECDATVRLWTRIASETATWPEPLISEIRLLLATLPRHPIHAFFKNISTAPASTPERLIDLFTTTTQLPPRREPTDPDAWVALDADQTAAKLGRNGEFAAMLPGYEYRGQQVNMAKAVTTAFNTSTHLLVEAGTGIGKSLAYLLPSVLWATTNGTPVVISTNTKNLQTQLFEKDLPLIRKALNIEFRAAIIKGRRNYLCLRKLLYLLDHAGQDLSPDEHMRMVRALVWATHTSTGDMSDGSAIEQPRVVPLAPRLSSAAEECLGQACKHRSRCFLYRARRKSLGADVVVANHSVVFAEMDNPDNSPVLPPHQHIVFDEAHNIEDSATNWLSVELSQTRIRFILGRLMRPGRRHHASGLLPGVLHELPKWESKLKQTIIERLQKETTAAIDAVEQTEQYITSLFQILADNFLTNADTSSVRLKPDRKPSSATDSALAEMLTALAQVSRTVSALIDSLRHVEEGELSYKLDFMQDLAATVTSLQEFGNDAAFVMAAADGDYVYWIERCSPRQGGARAKAAPIQVGQRLSDQLYALRHSIIFSSATLTVGGSYDFLKKRLGMDLAPPERITELNVGTPFDYRRQCRVLVPTFLPEPTESNRDYTSELGDMLAAVFRHTRGRGMALFTSYSMLKQTAEVLRGSLAGDGIQILAQGQSGSRENITSLFERDVESVLLGNGESDKEKELPVAAMFIFIGAAAHTDMLDGLVERDPAGFILTGRDINREGTRSWRLDRDPFPMETSVPGIFAAGDVRHQSVKRVASAVGEGAVAVALIHQYLKSV